MTSPHLTPYSAARGLGAAGGGARHWWAQRVSAIALVPLLLWLMWALASGAAVDHAALKIWLARPINIALMIFLLIAAFHHAALGLQVIAEDYIHSRARFIVVALVQLACVAGGTAGIVAVLMLGMTG